MRLAGKKGMSMEFIVGVVIVLAAFVVIALAIRDFMTKAETKEAEILCHNSLALKAKTEIDVGPAEISTPILCKTIDKEFSADTKEKAMEHFAASLERCWWMWLEGEKSEMLGPRGLFGSDEQTKCFVCYVLLYKNGEIFTKGELLSHLQENKAKKINSTYLEYVQKNGYIDIFDESFSSPGAYAVVFASNIEESFWASTFGRQLGFYPTYGRNGLWVVSLERLERQRPCYLQKDIAGE